MKRRWEKLELVINISEQRQNKEKHRGDKDWNFVLIARIIIVFRIFLIVHKKPSQDCSTVELIKTLLTLLRFEVLWLAKTLQEVCQEGQIQMNLKTFVSSINTETSQRTKNTKKNWLDPNQTYQTRKNPTGVAEQLEPQLDLHQLGKFLFMTFSPFKSCNKFLDENLNFFNIFWVHSSDTPHCTFTSF